MSLYKQTTDTTATACIELSVFECYIGRSWIHFQVEMTVHVFHHTFIHLLIFTMNIHLFIYSDHLFSATYSRYQFKSAATIHSGEREHF